MLSIRTEIISVKLVDGELHVMRREHNCTRLAVLDSGKNDGKF